MGTEEQELEIYTRVSAGGLVIRNRIHAVNHPISVRAAFFCRGPFLFRVTSLTVPEAVHCSDIKELL